MKTLLFSSSSSIQLLACLAVIYTFTSIFEKKQTTVSVAADKMNVFYIGVDNPVTVAVAGVSAEKVTVHSDNVEVTNLGQGHYNVRARKPGQVVLLVHGEGFEPKEMVFRVKRIPDPVAMLDIPGVGFNYNGTYSAEDFKKAEGVIPFLQNFDFETKMEIVEFSLMRVPKNGDPIEVINRGAGFSEIARKLIRQATPGDVFYFENIKLRTEGVIEHNVLILNSLVFQIK